MRDQIHESMGVSYIPSRGLAFAVHPAKSRYKYMLFLTAYFDESGSLSDPTKNFTGIAGFVAPIGVWNQVEREWDEIVRSPKFALTEYFHMKICTIVKKDSFLRGHLILEMNCTKIWYLSWFALR